jgi:hypothetical protein
MHSAPWVVLALAGGVSCKPASVPDATAAGSHVVAVAPSPTPLATPRPVAEFAATTAGPDSDAQSGAVHTERGGFTSAVLRAAAGELFGKRPVRARELVITELQLIAELVRATPKSARDRPLLLRRLADSYFELALRPLDGIADERAASASLQKAASTLEELLADDAAVRKTEPGPPGGAAAASLAPKDLAASVFRLGLAYELLGKTTQARNNFARVGTADPDSPFAGPAAQRVTSEP